MQKLIKKIIQFLNLPSIFDKIFSMFSPYLPDPLPGGHDFHQIKII